MFELAQPKIEPVTSPRLTTTELAPFTQELIELHKTIWNDKTAVEIRHDDGQAITHLVVHDHLPGVILDATRYDSYGITSSLHAICLLYGIKGDKEMDFTIPLGSLDVLDLKDDPYVALITNYFHSHNHN
ncbi:MAG: hypothetical protein ABI220_01295 [Candidatus Saccharimonadales bacterium]